MNAIISAPKTCKACQQPIGRHRAGNIQWCDACRPTEYAKSQREAKARHLRRAKRTGRQG